MGKNISNGKLTKQYVLSKVNQITIFSTYLNLSDVTVKNCIDTGELICSPIRDDVHPTCGFRYDNKGKLKFRDFSGFFWGDCFDIVAFIMSNMYNKQYNVSNKEDFIKILRHITFTFKDIFYGKERDINMINEINTSILNIKHKKQIIEVVIRDWNEEDYNYWYKFGVPLQFLNVNFIYPVEQYYINRNVNPEPKYYYVSNDPCYAYNLGQDRHGVNNIKLYFPYREKGITRFITNCNHLEGIYNLNGGNYDIIVITKSTKDRVSIGASMLRMKSLYGELKTFNVGVINLPHETYRLRQNEYDWLVGKLTDNGTIVSLMDNDMTGVREAIWLRDNYQIIPIIFPRKSGVKDFAEFVEQYKNKIYVVIKRCIQWIKAEQEKASGEREDTQSVEYDEASDSLPY